MMKTKQWIIGACLLFFGAATAQTKYQWHDPQKQAFQVVRGQAFPDECKGIYRRFADHRKESVPEHVWGNSLHSAGLTLNFYTNSPEIVVRYTVSNKHYAMSHMPATGVSGIDLYATDCHGKTMLCKGWYNFGDTITYTFRNLVYRNIHQAGYEFELFFPMYNSVEWMEIGVQPDKTFAFAEAAIEKPILVYGTSIAHGGCASRPAMAWPHIVHRNLELPIINWGFSGAGRLDSSMFVLMREVDARLYILDNMPNMPSLIDQIQYRLVSGVKMIREKCDTPILIVEHDGYTNEQTNDVDKQLYQRCNQECRKAYEQLQAEGVGNLYYMTYDEIAMDQDGMVDGVHSTDLGMTCYAKAYTRKIREILHMPIGDSETTRPCKQRREPGNYEWNERHQNILRQNRSQAPDIVMIGNSITHFWGGEPSFRLHYGEDSWNKMFKGKQVVNMGYGFDKIENVLWRVYHDELDGYKAKKIFMMLGTNNLNGSSDEEIVKGLKFLIPQIKKRQPEATLYVVGIYPRRNEEDHLKQLNAAIAQSLPQDAHIKYIDVSEALLQKDGKINESLFVGDGLHPNKEGYRKIAKLLTPYVK